MTHIAFTKCVRWSVSHSQQVSLPATQASMHLRLAWKPAERGPTASTDDAESPCDALASPSTALLCVYSVPKSASYGRTTTSAPPRVPATALMGASMAQAVRLRVQNKCNSTELPLLPCVVCYHFQRDAAPRAVCPSAIPGFEQGVLGCCWLTSPEPERHLLAISSDQSDPAGPSVDVVELTVPTNMVARSGERETDTKASVVTSIALTGPRCALRRD